MGLRFEEKNFSVRVRTRPRAVLTLESSRVPPSVIEADEDSPSFASFVTFARMRAVPGCEKITPRVKKVLVSAGARMLVSEWPLARTRRPTRPLTHGSKQPPDSLP